ncbi:hypothetical protein C731_4590 [Mycolicibacterium hassiacum DSM 44199]|jgi:hypothetical protein|uniref:Uncharacterized protein n=1 Tax=Mycolicibacterium hassiacum (strain DSM 44199 / CIP 105218 / JCM 12690 / 3849) TaxID=1122247 RepID=K5BCD2_MYCHD|nr:DUF937 domain-containing protein [Mycolicibacterium hassiacum]EKF21437.1 hypothetical protein C731_4590 [Mycolicibacterium hassiacum DSM 44199]MDA4086089.1 hypothetical protein [Mycolicibacterium hassiacum DSM 44199]PZN23152.1 MAG: DUF937 domain-containing protein [Mycolicibacterium hassiacum]VCT89548.1 hypothetical protein MHAS_01244 [Mycolicibacterium hassiacum DSM 44199]
MANLEELFAQIPIADLAARLGVDEAEVNNAVRTLVPALVGGMAQNVHDDDIDSSDLESSVAEQGSSSLLDGGVDIDQVDTDQGDRYVARIFDGVDSKQLASALAGGGQNSELIQKLLPIITPIVLAYIGKQLTKGSVSGGAEQASSGGGGLADILGTILGGVSEGVGDNPLGSILGSVLGGDKGGGLGSILGGLFGKKK